jgi:hypothetical protein
MGSQPVGSANGGSIHAVNQMQSAQNQVDQPDPSSVSAPLNDVRPKTQNQGPRIAQPASLMLAAGAGAGAGIGILEGVRTGAFVSFFTGAAVKSAAALGGFVGAAGLLSAVSAFCYNRFSVQLNRVKQGSETMSPEQASSTRFKKALSALSFVGSMAGLGLSAGALVTTLTGGTDFGLGLIIGGSVGFAAGLVGLFLLGRGA